MTNLDKLKMYVYESDLDTDTQYNCIEALESVEVEDFIETSDAVITLASLSGNEDVITEGVIDAIKKIPTEGKLLAVSATVVALLATLDKITESDKIKNGYEKDPELAQMKKNLETLQKDIKSTVAKYQTTSKKLMNKAEEYNKLIDTTVAPKIKFGTITQIPASYMDTKKEYEKILNQCDDQRKKLIKQYENKLDDVYSTVENYTDICEELLSYTQELNDLKERMNKLAKKRPISAAAKVKKNFEKHEINMSINDKKRNYDDIKSEFDQREKDIDVVAKESVNSDDYFDTLKLAVYESGFDYADIKDIINIMESSDESNREEICQHVAELFED